MASAPCPKRQKTSAAPSNDIAIIAPPTTQTQSPTEFHGFPNLPIELRLMVWSYALPRRVIDIFAHKYETWTDDELDFIPKRLNMDIEPEPGQRIHMERVFARLCPTPLSAVNAEARNFLPVGYKTRMNTDITPPEDYTRIDNEVSPEPGQTYFRVDEDSSANFTKINFERDVIFFRALGCQREERGEGRWGLVDLGHNIEIVLALCGKDVLERVKHLAISYIDEQKFWMTQGLEGDEWIPPILHLPNLETLHVVSVEHRRIRVHWKEPRILRGQEKLDYYKERKIDQFKEISCDLDDFAEKHPDWNRPKLKVVHNVKALRRSVGRSR